MSVREAVGRVMRGEELTSAMLEAAFTEITEGKASEVGIAALLVGLRMRGETVDEIVGAARALRAAAVKAPCLDPATIDTCGTGGDGADTFNISTTAAFVVAGAGVPVAKHGNRAASSRSGSIDVLEALGVKIDLPIDASARVLSEVGIAPFFALLAHPAMRFVAPVRRELGVRTLMNCMGPLLNPLGVRMQLIGVYTRSLVPMLAAALGELGSQRALVVHGADGLDEVTTTDVTFAALLEDGVVRELEIDPASLGIERAAPEALAGGDAAENAKITLAVLEGESGPRRDIVRLNAASALWAGRAAVDLAEGLEHATESLDSGAARSKLGALIDATQAVAP